MRYRLRPLSIASWVLWAATARAATPPDIPPDEFHYYAQPRDTLIGVSRRLLRDPRRWPEVQRHNHIIDPRRIPPGSILAIPYEWLRLSVESATVTDLAGAVDRDGRSLNPGDRLGPGSVIHTGEDGSVTLDLADGSVVTLHKSSTLELDEMARVAGTDSARSIRLHLRSGRVEARVKPHRDVGRFEIQTPVAVSAVRGTEFRNGFDEADRRSTAETLEGAVGVAGATGSVAIPAGFGTRVEQDRAPLPPVALLSPPNLAGVDERQSAPAVQLQWAAVAGARAYRVQVAAEPGFKSLSEDRAIPDTAVALSVADGEHWLRVRSIDTLGLEGVDAVRHFTRHRLPPAPALSAPSAGTRVFGTVHLAWQASEPTPWYAVQVSNDPSFESMVIDRRLETAALDLDVLPPGGYFWRVASVSASGESGSWSVPSSFAQRTAPAMPDAPRVHGKQAQFSWRPFAERGYRVQIDADANFANPVVDVRTDDPLLSLPRLFPGVYYVRVQGTDADGSVSAFGPARRFLMPVPLWVKIVAPIATGLAFLL